MMEPMETENNGMVSVECGVFGAEKSTPRLSFTRSLSSPELTKKLSRIYSQISATSASANVDAETGKESGQVAEDVVGADNGDEITRLVRQDTSPIAPEDETTEKSAGSKHISRLNTLRKAYSNKSRESSLVLKEGTETEKNSLCKQKSDSNNNIAGSCEDVEDMDATPAPETRNFTDGSCGGENMTALYADPPPGSPIEIAFSFDTTGSMSQCLDEVRVSVQEIITRLFSDIPNLRIAIIAHGDYCDAEMYGYVTKFVDFTADQNALCEFVREVSGTGGGDFEECYELVLRQTRDSLSWTAGTHRSLVMIGDAIPHPVSETQQIDWRQEADRLHKEMGVRIYGVQCMNEKGAAEFFSDLSGRTDGRHLKLDNFSTIVDIIMAICYREHMPEYLEAFEREVRNREGRAIRHELTQMFDALRDHRPVDVPSCTPAESSTSAPVKTKQNTPHLKKHARAQKLITGSKIINHRRKTVPAKASSTNTKKTRKTPSCTQRKKVKALTPKTKRREIVPHSQFILNNQRWSRWEMVLAPSTQKTQAELWSERSTENSKKSYRRNHIYSRRTQYTYNVVYEFGVQPKNRKKIYTTFVRATKGFPSRYAGFWERYLLGRDHIAEEINDCLDAGCRIYVRRCVVTSSAAEFAKTLRKTYDYAWNKQCKSLHRTVIKHGVTLSKGK